MFTGLVEATGRLASRVERGPSHCIRVETDLGPLSLGESIAVDGACLTVTLASDGSFRADVSTETVERTTLGAIAPGSVVNLERSMKVGDRLGGHLVSGHVDGVAAVERVAAAGDAKRVTIRVPRGLSKFIAAKGSVALDGVSLTVNRVDGDGFEVMLIPHTLDVTNLKRLAPGARMNVEVDLVARYVARLLEARDSDGHSDDPIAGALERAGRLP